MGNLMNYEAMDERNDSKAIVISEHAYMRLKERNGWSRKAAARMIDKVYQKGLRPAQVKGYLKCWINNKAVSGKLYSIVRGT